MTLSSLQKCEVAMLPVRLLARRASSAQAMPTWSNYFQYFISGAQCNPGQSRFAGFAALDDGQSVNQFSLLPATY
jgi:hypothetical protein